MGFERVGPDEQNARRGLAEGVLSALLDAGLPAWISDIRQVRFGGVKVDVDLGDDAAGGVFIHWSPGDRLVQEMTDSVISTGGYDHPSVARCDRIIEVMRDALELILGEAGWVLERSTNDLAPLALRVISEPAGG